MIAIFTEYLQHARFCAQHFTFSFNVVLLMPCEVNIRLRKLRLRNRQLCNFSHCTHLANANWDSTSDLSYTQALLSTQLLITSSSLRTIKHLSKCDLWRCWQRIFKVCVEEVCLYLKTHQPNGEIYLVLHLFLSTFKTNVCLL